LSLARALYSESDILLFDDPISAVDSKVGKIIYESCLKKLKNIKTVILVTHQIGFLYDCDEVLILESGEILAKGSPLDLKE
jgi:ATP-binding cassette subfamily C (CFTR/MRP) protein 4